MSFKDFALDDTILYALESMGYKAPTPIQEKAIPMILDNMDLIAMAHTGSGKTAACAIPVCNKVDANNKKIQALIVVPTRELAIQYATEAQKIGKRKGVNAFGICGGESADLQLSKIRHGVQVLVATPGRLIDFIYSRQIDLAHVETLILDEADEMLSMGFYEDLEFIIQCLIHEHQTLLFSATMPPEIKKIAQNHMKSPTEVNLSEHEISPASIDHYFLYTPIHHREDTLIKQIQEQKPHQAIIFCHSRIQVERVHGILRKQLRDVDFLHAGLNQNVRSNITQKFRKTKIKYLVATDVAARGLDFAGVSHVFIYQMSDDPDLYVHRSGRTGRHDRKGTVITLVTDREVGKLYRIMEKLNRQPEWIGEPPPKRGPSKGGGGGKRRLPYQKKTKNS